MKRKIFTILCILFAGSQVFAQDNERACLEFQERLNLIKKFIEGEDVDSTLRRAEAVFFMEQLTKIESESPCIAEAKLNPTKRDYVKWNEWFLVNKSKLHWNKRKKKVFIKS